MFRPFPAPAVGREANRDDHRPGPFREQLLHGEWLGHKIEPPFIQPRASFDRATMLVGEFSDRGRRENDGNHGFMDTIFSGLTSRDREGADEAGTCGKTAYWRARLVTNDIASRLEVQVRLNCRSSSSRVKTRAVGRPW